MHFSQFDTWLLDESRQTLVMGILNVTPDSFSDGGQYADAGHAVAAALAMVAAGADMIDVGAQSTRPGSTPVTPAEEIRRALPVVCELRRQSSVLISIDTSSAQVAEAMIAAGGNIINDISAGEDDPAMLPLAARLQAPIILMHKQGTPATMQRNPQYQDVLREVTDYLLARRQAALAAGIARHRILLDPGIGFGKTTAHDLRLLNGTRVLAGLGQPLVVGVSRKRVVGEVTDVKLAKDRLMGTAAVISWVVANQTGVVRVHDIEPIVQTVRMVRAIATAK